MNTSLENTRLKRIQRIEDAIALRVPDRVPFFPQTNFLALQYGGITGSEAFQDFEKWFSACKQMNIELTPDLCWPPIAATPGRAYDMLGCTQILWPDQGVPENSSVQFIDRAYMAGEEIDLFIDDPTEFILGTYLPRVFQALKPLAALPDLKSLFYHGYKSVLTLSAFTEKEIAVAFDTLREAAVESARYASHLKTYEASLRESGLVQAFSGLTVLCPFDVLGDYYRGIRGVMTDMYRQPEKLTSAMDKIHPMLIKRARDISRSGGTRRIFIPLHLGADTFMSEAQFERFYWPYLKDLIQTLIEEDLTPCPFFEGDYTSRLKYLARLPRGKILGMFDKTDLTLAKKVIGDTMCIVGNMPVPLLKHGTVDQIKLYTKHLIDIVGKDGGFIMSSRSVLDDADKERVQIWGDYTKKYGVYN